MPFKDPEAKKAYDRKRYQDNKEDFRKKSLDYYHKNKEARREYYYENKERKVKVARDKRHGYKQAAIDYTGGLSCHNPKCGWHGDLALYQIDFHHVIKANKTENFSKLFRGSWEKVKNEIDRCKAIPLCANCHNAETWSRDERRRILD